MQKLRFHLQITRFCKSDRVCEPYGGELEKRVTAHTLRHTAATWLRQATGDARLVAEYLGHSDLLTVSRYAHVAGDELHEAAAALAVQAGLSHGSISQRKRNPEPPEFMSTCDQCPCSDRRGRKPVSITSERVASVDLHLVPEPRSNHRGMNLSRLSLGDEARLRAVNQKSSNPMGPHL